MNDPPKRVVLERGNRWAELPGPGPPRRLGDAGHPERGQLFERPLTGEVRAALWADHGDVDVAALATRAGEPVRVGVVRCATQSRARHRALLRRRAVLRDPGDAPVRWFPSGLDGAHVVSGRRAGCPSGRPCGRSSLPPRPRTGNGCRTT